MAEKDFGKSVFFAELSSCNDSRTPGSNGYAASIDRRGNVTVAPLNENTNRISYKEMRNAILKKR